MQSPFDPAQMAMHDAEAARRFPGPDYYEVLAWIHQALKPETYVEIGILHGCSLRIAQPPTLAIGIDPDPLCTGPWAAETQVHRMTSAEFFLKYDLRRLLGERPLSFAFIDGRHLFEQALKDFCSLERYAGEHTIIAVHDTIPLDAQTSARERTTEFYSGDVWKLVPFLRQHQPKLEMITIPAAPTGLTLIRGFGTPSALPDPGHIAGFAALSFDDFRLDRNLVPNHRPSVEAFCQKTPVQSIASIGVPMR